jgi:hypothetical protein
MIPECLIPLLSRLKNPPTGTPDPLGAELLSAYSSTAITLIEEGINARLVRKFKDQAILEEFIWRAALIIGTPMDKEDRETNWEDMIDGKFDKLFDGLKELDNIGIDNITDELNITKKNDRVFNALRILKKSYESINNPPSSPTKIHILINLFREYLPEESNPFMDSQIRKMLNPFGINLRKDTVRMKLYRAEEKGECFIRQKENNRSK